MCGRKAEEKKTKRLKKKSLQATFFFLIKLKATIKGNCCPNPIVSSPFVIYQLIIQKIRQTLCSQHFKTSRIIIKHKKKKKSNNGKVKELLNSLVTHIITNRYGHGTSLSHLNWNVQC